MLENSQREQLLDRLGLPISGRRLVLDAAKHAPVRQVRSKGGGNVITPYQSRKMQRTVETESRHIEFPAAVSLEYDPDVLEYYPQPCRLKFEVIDADGEIHAIDHTPDFLIIGEHSVVLEERKPWSKLEGLARRHPWRYQLGPDGYWYAPLIEKWLADRGIGYRIRTDRDIPQRRIENILMLEEHLHPSAPPCPIDITQRVHEALAENAVLYLAELYEKCDCRTDDVFKLIADGLLVSDIDVAPLEDPHRCRVFRDTAVRAFEHARLRPAPQSIAGVVDIRAGAHVMYDQHPYTVVMVGGNKAVLQSDDGRSVEVAIDTLEQLALKQDLTMVDGAASPSEPVSLSDCTEEELKIALSRKTALENVTTPNRSQRRHLKALALAKLAGIDELVALVPRLRDRGNRKPRLSEAQEAAIDDVIAEFHLNSVAANHRHVHDRLKVLCAERSIKTPSYPTLITRIKAIPQEKADRARHGNRVAYQNSEFISVLYADTPVHGSRFLQYVHMDHTELDLELISLKTGKCLGRPWLSLAIDAYTRCIVGIYLSYDPPSYRSNMMLLRDIVRRQRRLPQFIVVDNGSDFRSQDFDNATVLLRIHVRYRPAGRPRHGAIMERIFGHAHSAYVHNLAGNTKATKKVRQTTGKFLPSRLAEWCLEYLYYGLEYWAFEYYDSEIHPTLGMTPSEARERSLANTGLRSHRIVTLTRELLILTCPTVSRSGVRKVDRQRGVKVHNNFYYWCPELRNPEVHKKCLPVRYDPWDGATVYIKINKRWVAAHCKALIGLGQLTEKERQLITTELTRRFRLREDEEPSQQKLKEFLRTFTPEGAARLDFERQQENRELYEHLRLGAITPPTYLPQLVYPSSASSIDINSVPGSSYTPIASPFIKPSQADDLEFDTF
jgi:putative transposase